jgi:hypothetical protein
MEGGSGAENSSHEKPKAEMGSPRIAKSFVARESPAIIRPLPSSYARVVKQTSLAGVIIGWIAARYGR